MHPPTNRRERLLIYGRSNSGKSSCWLSVASWIADTGSKERVYLGDTDNAWDAMSYPEIEPVVSATHTTNYIEGLKWAKSLREQVSRDDWAVFDLADKAWPWSQEHYFSTVSGDDEFLLGDVYLKNQLAINKEAGGESMGGSHGANWGIIYKYYHGFVNAVLNLPCHVMFVAAAKELRPDSRPTIVAQYKDLGFYPAGPPNENELAHNFHSVIYCAETVRGWVYTSVKERGPINKPKRAMLKGKDVTESDFVQEYLIPIAGWRL